MSLGHIIIKPIISEKALKENEQLGTYCFIVDLKANKYQIKTAIETIYNVKVVSVNTLVRPGKMKRFGQAVKKSTKSKKAMIRLVEGQKIELFKGV